MLPEINLSRCELVGDINLFLDIDDDGVKRGEINIMIAVESARRMGLAREAILLLMHYAFVRLHICRFMCKINETNEASRALFKT